MNAAYPARVFFNEFNRDSINIQMIIWYHSTDYWAFQAFNEKLNLNIMQQFEQAGIRYALPSFNTYAENEPARETALIPEDGRGLQVESGNV